MPIVPIFALLLAVGDVPVSAAPAPAFSLTISFPTSAADYRNPRYRARAGARYGHARPRYFSFKTKRGARILCRTTWRGSRSTRTCWRRH